jgi:hypothetical protein
MPQSLIIKPMKSLSDSKTKLLLALLQVENLTSLLEKNEYQKYLYSHLISIQVELERQLSHYANSIASET